MARIYSLYYKSAGMNDSIHRIKSPNPQSLFLTAMMGCSTIRIEKTAYITLWMIPSLR